LIVTIIITVIVEATTILIDGMAITKAGRVNVMCARRKTAVYRDIY